MQCQLFDTISSWSTDSLARTLYVFDQMPTYYYTVWTVSVFVSALRLYDSVANPIRAQCQLTIYLHTLDYHWF